MRRQYIPPTCLVAVMIAAPVLAASSGNSYGDDDGLVGTGNGKIGAELGE